MFERVVVGLIAVVAASIALLSMLRAGFNPISVMIQALLLTIAFMTAWFAAVGHVEAERARMARTLVIGAAVGIVGFLGGFIGPMILTPGANQGPLLGIFVTGPDGAAKAPPARRQARPAVNSAPEKIRLRRNSHAALRLAKNAPMRSSAFKIFSVELA